MWKKMHLLEELLLNSLNTPDGPWRTNTDLFHPSTIFRGYINMSLAWFQQGHHVSLCWICFAIRGLLNWSQGGQSVPKLSALLKLARSLNRSGIGFRKLGSRRPYWAGLLPSCIQTCTIQEERHWYVSDAGQHLPKYRRSVRYLPYGLLFIMLPLLWPTELARCTWINSDVLSGCIS